MNVLVAALLLWGAPQEIPRLAEPVADLAGVMTPAQRSAAIQVSKALQASDSTQVVLVTIPTLNNGEIAEYALKVGRENGIGQKGSNNGVIIIVAVQDRKVRIEVGTGLEGKLTDALSATIIRNEMVPYFKKGDFGSGAVMGMQAVVKAVKGEYKGRGYISQNKKKVGSWVGIIVFLLFLFLAPRRGGGMWLLTGYALGGGFRGGHGGGGGGGGGSFGGGGASGSW